MILEIDVYDMSGKKVTVNKLSTKTLYISNLAKGIYIIKIKEEND